MPFHRGHFLQSSHLKSFIGCWLHPGHTYPPYCCHTSMGVAMFLVALFYSPSQSTERSPLFCCIMKGNINTVDLAYSESFYNEVQAGPVLGWGDRCGCTGPHSERAPYLRERGYYNCYKQVVQGPPVAHVKGDPPLIIILHRAPNMLEPGLSAGCKHFRATRRWCNMH